MGSPRDLNRILYDIDVIAIWKPDDENVAEQDNSDSQLSLFRNAEGHPSYSQLPRRVFRQVTHRLARSLEGLAISTTVPPALLQALPKVLSEWAMQLSPDGEILAILQEHKIEFRANKDGFESVHSIYKYTVKRDTFPKWRRIAWSLDSRIIAASRSDGTVDVVDVEGKLVCVILPTSKTSNVVVSLSGTLLENETEAQQAGSSFFLEPVAFLAFVDPKRGLRESSYKGYIYQYELIVISYDGILRSYLLNATDPATKVDSSLRRPPTRIIYSREGDSDPGLFMYYHRFSFKQWLSTVVCGEVDHESRLLCLGGKPNTPSEENGVKPTSVACWLLLAERPFYRNLDLEVAMDLPIEKINQLSEEASIDDSGFFSRLKNVFSTWRKMNKDFTDEIVVRMVLSPDKTSLLTLEFSGTIKIWKVSLSKGVEAIQSWNPDQLNYFGRGREYKELSLEQFNEKIEDIEDDGGSVVGIAGLDNGIVLSIGWWSNNAVILGYQNGSLVIISLSEMENILGDAPEVFKSCREITSQWDKKFLVIENENKTIRARVHGDNVISYSRAQEEGDDDEFDEEKSLMRKIASAIGNSLHYVTDTFLWHFESDSSSMRGKFITISKRTFRLNRISKILPKDLLYRKILALEYNEALAIAETYKLDTDPIYQAQWRDAEITEVTIHDYLGKVHNREWVLSNCLERIPDSKENVQMLLDYALELSNILDQILQESSVTTFEPGFAKNLRERPLDRLPEFEFLNQMKISEYHLNICRYRYYTLKYLDRLHTFQEILNARTIRDRNTGSMEASEEGNWLTFADYTLTFAEDYALFRDVNIAAQAMDFATEEFFEGLQILFTRHGPETLPYRFNILEQIPETSDPDAYSIFLPSVGNDNENNLCECLWQEKPWRQPDWVENPIFKSRILGQNELEECDFEGIALHMTPYPAPSADITKWYYDRAHKIDCISGQVDTALKFIRHGIEKNVRDLETLEENLHMLAILVYECYSASDPVSISTTLVEWEDYSEAEIVQKFLGQTDKTRIVSDVKQFVLPFLQLLSARHARIASDHHNNKYMQLEPMNLLYDYILTLSEIRLDLCCLLFEASKPTLGKEERIIVSDKDLAVLALSCLYGNDSNDQWAVMTRIFECLPIFDVEVTNVSDTLIDIKNWQSPLTPSCFLELFRNKNEEELQCIIESLDIHLNAVDILSRYDNPVPLRWFLQSLNDYHLQKQLSIKLVRKASGGPDSRGERLESEDEWTLLLEDMMKLYDNGNGVLGKLSIEEIYKDFISGLLNCGKLELAREILLPVDQPKPLEISTAEKLVIDASREFFDNATSGNMHHGYMKIAYQCLQILPKSDAIKSELEFIEATHILTERKIFYQPGIPIHPIQIRLAPNRLDLIARLLSTNETVYQNPELILELARKLGFRQDKVAEVKVMAMLADAALRATDYTTAYQLCNDVVRAAKNIATASSASTFAIPGTNYIEQYPKTDSLKSREANDVSWRVCYEVGKQENFPNLEQRMILLGYALAFCPTEQAINILNLWRKLEAKNEVHLKQKASDLLGTEKARSVVEEISELGVLGAPILKIDRLKSLVMTVSLGYSSKTKVHTRVNWAFNLKPLVIQTSMKSVFTMIKSASNISEEKCLQDAEENAKRLAKKAPQMTTNQQALKLISLPTEILFLIVFSINNPKDLRSFATTNRYFRELAGPHTVTAQLWFDKNSRNIASEKLLRTANEWGFPLTIEHAKRLLLLNAPTEPTCLFIEPPGPRRALQRIERVLHIVEQFALFLHNMLAVNYYYTHDWDALQLIADEVDQYLEDYGWVEFYRGQMKKIDSRFPTVKPDEEFYSVAFKVYSGKLKNEIALMSTIKTSPSKKTKASNSYGYLGLSETGKEKVQAHSNDNESFASISSEELYLKWTSLIQDQLDLFSLEKHIMDKFKPPNKWQLAEYLSAVLSGNI
ncbi:hypothetical protein G9A89_022908 [Geosiphon pyriformis]|nr:hypothetical protein G9A89_022908 [Geosiphon pyriformis]